MKESDFDKLSDEEKAKAIKKAKRQIAYSQKIKAEKLALVKSMKGMTSEEKDAYKAKLKAERESKKLLKQAEVSPTVRRPDRKGL